jgi:endonuclease G
VRIIIALVVVACVAAFVFFRGDKASAAPESQSVSRSVSGTQQPAVDEDWLELPGAVTDANYEVNTYYDSLVRNYTHLYDRQTYTSLWTAYPLNSTYMGSEPRPSKWSYSTSIDTRHQVNLRNRSYKDSYSRGHMIPNASRDGNKAMQAQTFFVTNSVPQIQNSFNSGIWSKLEGDLQDLGAKEEIYIVTGVAFNKTGEDKPVAYTSAKDDTKKVPIPNYFYKVVLRVKTSGGKVTSASTIGFWMDHRKYSDSYTNYTASVDQIEQWTGFDFFVNLPDSIESSAESNSSWSAFQDF